MADGPETLCFTCGLPSGKDARLNHLANGQVCPSCRDRLLAMLPAPFPVGVARVPFGGSAADEAVPEPVDGIPEPYDDAGDEESERAGELVHLRRPAARDDYGPEPA